MTDNFRWKWSSVEVLNLGAAFKTRGTFKAAHVGAYQFARRHGLLPIMFPFSHRDRSMRHQKSFRFKLKKVNNPQWNGIGKAPNNWWTKHRCHLEALKYPHRGLFQEGSPAAEVIARRNGWVDDICQHMTPAPKGFQPDKPARLYYAKIKNGSEWVYKIGVTQRKMRHRFEQENIEYLVLRTWLFKVGSDAEKTELRIKRHCADYLYDGPQVMRITGNTEIFSTDILRLAA